MINDEYIKLPRLYVDEELKDNALIPLATEQAHYLKNVLRQKIGDSIRIFNGRDGEWHACLQDIGKKSVTIQITARLKEQPPPPAPLILAFAPVKKARLDFLIEKATEIGVTALQPVLTRYTENRKLNMDRVRRQITEAAEQCERLDIPVLQDAYSLDEFLAYADKDHPVLACIERQDAPPISDVADHGATTLLVGSEGGFSPEEKEDILARQTIKPVRLGPHILRAETACLYALTSIIEKRSQNT